MRGCKMRGSAVMILLIPATALAILGIRAFYHYVDSLVKKIVAVPIFYLFL